MFDDNLSDLLHELVLRAVQIVYWPFFPAVQLVDASLVPDKTDEVVSGLQLDLFLYTLLCSFLVCLCQGLLFALLLDLNFAVFKKFRPLIRGQILALKKELLGEALFFEDEWIISNNVGNYVKQGYGTASIFSHLLHVVEGLGHRSLEHILTLIEEVIIDEL